MIIQFKFSYSRAIKFFFYLGDGYHIALCGSDTAEN